MGRSPYRFIIPPLQVLQFALMNGALASPEKGIVLHFKQVLRF